MGTMKMVGGIAMMVAVVYLCAELIPPYFANYEFEDAIKNEAQMATYSTKTEDAIRDEMFKKAQELDIPVVKDQIKVQRTGAQNAGSVSIEVPYTVHLDLPGYPVDLNFDPATRNRSVF